MAKRRLDDAGTRMHNFAAELDLKMPMSEGPKIVAMFKDYARYTELEELYKKVVPPIATFQNQLSAYHTEQEKNRVLIQRFDEVLTNKVNKEALSEFRAKVAFEYSTKTENAAFIAD